MDKNHQDKTESKLITTEDKIWLPPLSPKEQEQLDRLQKKRTKANNEKIGMRKRGNLLARFFKVWATPLTILISVGGLLWGVYQFNAQQSASVLMQTTQEKASAAQTLDQQRQTTFDTYCDRMSDLLLMDHLRTNPDAQAIAGARTATVLLYLDGYRKAYLIRFLWDAKLINLPNPILKRSAGLNLTGADFAIANISPNLNNVSLIGDILYGANLSRVRLLGADLRNTSLQGANLSGADLRGAYLGGARYNTKTIQVKDAQGNPLTLEPTQWPQGVNPIAVGAICVDCSFF